MTDMTTAIDGTGIEENATDTPTTNDVTRIDMRETEEMIGETTEEMTGGETETEDHALVLAIGENNATMNATGILVRDAKDDNPIQRDLWTASHERLEKFLPGFLDEIIPPAPQQDPAPSAPPTTEASPAGPTARAS